MISSVIRSPARISSLIRPILFKISSRDCWIFSTVTSGYVDKGDIKGFLLVTRVEKFLVSNVIPAIRIERAWILLKRSGAPWNCNNSVTNSQS